MMSRWGGGVAKNVTIVLIGCVTGTVTRGVQKMREICVTLFMDGPKGESSQGLTLEILSRRVFHFGMHYAPTR